MAVVARDQNMNGLAFGSLRVNPAAVAGIGSEQEVNPSVVEIGSEQEVNPLVVGIGSEPAVLDGFGWHCKGNIGKHSCQPDAV